MLLELPIFEVLFPLYR